MTEFLYVAGAALVLLVAGGLLAGYMPADAGTDARVAGDGLFTTNIGPIGSINATSRTALSERSVTVAESSPNKTVHERDALRVSSSAFGASSHLFEVSAAHPQQLYISFIPTGPATSRYLSITVNGEELDLSNYETGSRVTVSTDDLRRGSNVIRVSAERPGFQVWRSPTYTLQNVDVILNDLEHTGNVHPFTVYDYELDGFDHGELRFLVDQDVARTQPLQIAVNGQTVAERTPIKRALPYEITFHANTTGLQAGENVLSLTTQGDAAYTLSNVNLDVYHFAGDIQRTTRHEFNLSQQWYNRLGKEAWEGRVTYDVQRMPLPRPITFQFPGESFSEQPAPGENTFTFTQNAVQQGTNTVRLSTDGAYTIGDLTIDVVETGK